MSSGPRDSREIVDVDLSESERYLLTRGLLEWGGPARISDDLARAMGFSDREGFFAERDRLVAALDEHAAVSRFDWTRIVLATEIVFASDVLGAGVEWSTVTGLDDAESLSVLRGLQRTLGHVLSYSSVGE